jgi:hypothetical protein
MRWQAERLKSALAIVALLGAAVICRAGEPSREYKVKAAFIYNFARFIEWPPEVFPNSEAPFVVAVVGADPFDGALEQVVSGKKIGARRVEIRHFDSIDNIGPCQILFVPSTDDVSEARIIQKIGNDHVLSVGESETFAANGGTLRFFSEGNKIRFEVNTDAADRARLQISSKLLNLARIFKK